MINWKVRLKSPQFWIGMIGVVMSPILAYLGLAYSDLTTWTSLADVFMQFITNPFLVGTVVVAVLSALGVITDPTVKGLSDSPLTMAKTAPESLTVEDAAEILAD